MLGDALALDHPPPVFRRAQITITVMAAAIAVLAFTETAPIIVIRYAALFVFALQIWIEIIRRDYIFLKSPVFLLGFAACVGFSLLPSSGYFIAQGGYIPHLNMDSFTRMFTRPDILTYFGDTAEFYILAFSVVALFTYGIVQLVLRKWPPPAALPISGAIERALMAISFALTGLATLNFALHPFPPSVSGVLSSAYPPLQSILVMVLAHQYFTKESGAFRFAATGISVIVFYAATAQAKAPLFLLVSVLFYYAYVKKISVSSAVKLSLALFVFIFVVAQVSQVMRSKGSSIIHQGDLDITMAMDIFTGKMFWRQVDTGACLSNVIGANLIKKPANPDHMFWLRGLVPRMLWPEKESLSLGSKYAVAYCQTPVETRHSASITLLGQPIIKAGIAGMVIHTGILLAALGTLTWIAIRYPGLGAVSVMALLPWWIDFDQDFALYVANLVKFFLLMCLILIPLFWLGRSNAPANTRTTEISSRTVD